MNTREHAIAVLEREVDYEPEPIVNDVRRVRVFGDVAVATAQGTVRGTHKGQRADMVFMYTRIWVEREGVWHAVAAHANVIESLAFA